MKLSFSNFVIVLVDTRAFNTKNSSVFSKTTWALIIRILKARIKDVMFRS
jgi:hypothetical protein